MKKTLLALLLTFSLGACGGGTGTTQDPTPALTPQQRLSKLLGQGVTISDPSFTEYAQDSFTIHSFSLTNQSEAVQGTQLTLNADGTLSTFEASPLLDFPPVTYEKPIPQEGHEYVSSAPEGDLMHDELFNAKLSYEITETPISPILKFYIEGDFYSSCYGTYIGACAEEGYPKPVEQVKKLKGSYVIEHADDTGFVIQTDQYYILLIK